MPSYAPELTAATALAHQAGELLLRHRAQGFTVEYKTSKDDPVTVADREASELIVAGLQAHFPADGILSEELADSPQRLTRQRVWVIDPIDGTQEYTQGEADYCVSIGLVVDGEPVLGVVYAPSHKNIYTGVIGQGVYKNGAAVGLNATLTLQQARISVSDSEHRRELHAIALPNMQPSGSIALKLAKMAAGDQEATFTMSPRSEWDLAAGHALLRAAGGDLRRRDGSPILYNQPSPQIEQGIIGGRLDVVEHLESELSRLQVPLHHLDAKNHPLQPTALALQEGQTFHLRYSGPKLLAWAVLDGNKVVQVWGNAADLQALLRDLRRAYGA